MPNVSNNVSIKDAQKKLLRKEMLSKRDGQSPDLRLKNSQKIHENLLKQEFYKNASSVYCYVSFRSEADTRELLQYILHDEKTLFIPRVEVRYGEMQFYQITSVKELLPGTFGILEPDPSKCFFHETHPSGLMLLPGAAFARNGRRLGYGGGYYDRYLERYPKFYKAALAFECQICEELPQEETDIQMDAVITESCVYYCAEYTGKL